MTGTLELLMAEPTPLPETTPQGPAFGSVRIAGDLMEMMRIICFNTKDTRGARLKYAAYIDSIIRAQVTADYNRIIAPQQQAAKKKS